MKRIPLKEDKIAYRSIIAFDCMAIILSMVLAILIEPILLILSLPFAYDLYHVYVYKERTVVSYISEILTLVP